MLSFVLLGLFFIFKQKTAYEMRISDWSSDVCSSDLNECVVRRFRRNRIGATIETDDHPKKQTKHEKRDDRDNRQQDRIVDPFCILKIGRASCRERVCPSVQISVVPASSPTTPTPPPPPPPPTTHPPPPPPPPP